MSFGISASDFFVVGTLCWNTYKQCKESPGLYRELAIEVGALHNVIKETEELLSQQRLTTDQKTKLQVSKQGCEDVLKDLETLLKKYESLGTQSQRTFDRMGMAKEDINNIRIRLISNVTLLDAFNTALTKQLNRLIAEVRSGKREGSIVSVRTIDAAAQNDQQTWDALRRELEDIGISSTVIIEKRQFIVQWFLEAVATGKLEEDIPEERVAMREQEAPADDNDSAIALYDQDDDEDLASLMSAQRIEGKDGGFVDLPNEGAPPVRRRSTSKVDKMFQPLAINDGGNATISRAKADPLQTHEVDDDGAQPVQNAKLRLRMSYLLGRLRTVETQLLQAAKSGNIRRMSELMSKGVDANTKDDMTGRTPLHMAAEAGHVYASGLLLRSSVDLNQSDATGHTALHLAAKNNHVGTSRILLSYEADVDAITRSGMTARQLAVFNKSSRVLPLLPLDENTMETTTTELGIPKPMGKGQALRMAALQGYTARVRRLLDAGMGLDVSLPTFGDPTALHLAIATGHSDVIRLLIQRGADIERKSSFNLTKHSEIAQSLHLAAFIGNHQIVKMLLDAGARVDAKTGSGNTALHCAAINGHRKVVRMLLEKGSCATWINDDRQTPLSMVQARKPFQDDNGYRNLINILSNEEADLFTNDRVAFSNLSQRRKMDETYSDCP